MRSGLAINCHQSGHAVVLFIGLVLVCVPAFGQAQDDRAPTPGSTILAPAFIEKLGLDRIGWPGAAEQERARDAYTDYARYDTVRWITRLVAPSYRPFPTEDPPATVRDPLGREYSRSPFSTPEAGEYRTYLTAAISDSGEDLMCARWSAAGYSFQFIAALDVIRLSIEPVQAGPRGGLTPEQTVARVRAFLARVLEDAERNLRFCEFDCEPTAYGGIVRVRCTDIESRQRWQRQFATDDDDWDTALEHQWALSLVMHTDGVSFVLDVLPMTSVNVIRHGKGPDRRWFIPPRGAVVVPRPTSAPAPNTEAQQEAMRRLIELRERMIREEEQRKQK